jgi:hypothetical protein
MGVCVVLAETDSLSGLTHSVVKYVTLNLIYVTLIESTTLNSNTTLRYLFKNVTLTTNKRNLTYFKISKLYTLLVKTLYM